MPVRRFRAEGDRVALNALFNRYLGRVRRIVRIQMGSGLLQLTEYGDLVQNALVVAFRKLEEIDIRDHSA
ncbi:MAG: DNA-directed RNA polymerase specialized sigma24 family protein [Planctomycetota bacterium]